ncbi:Aste57867_24512 [Aphanomyces stellatus]|uniref:Aste57867_24512 protein n=1 Tax=Aphanomyces stellatus TaxID=120398 RepID=A0A485LRB1_9STRA|nr:hypothetical protein As57867_024435 [Aphanomyces stellatus]VFU01151.1 Aste57867_24512 [Aphanomyces stellatus]
MGHTSLLLVVAATATALSIPFVRRFDIMEHIDASVGRNSVAGVPDQWFETQKLDHFDASNEAVWKQRFFTNDAFYGGAGSPVFIYLNGENVASNTTVTTPGLFMNVLAKKHKAFVVALEHRYYGKSQPMPDLSTANLKYLSANQALHDLARVQDHVIATYDLGESPWVVFGGSYPGMLAAWSKLTFSDRFLGAVASSGPIRAKADYFEYGDVVAFGLQYYGKEQCVDAVQQALEAFDALVGSSQSDDAAHLDKLFKPCTPLEDDFDRAAIESNVFGNFQNLAQGNDVAASNLKTTCDAFVKEDGQSPLEKLAAFNHAVFPDCTPSSYADTVVGVVNNTNYTTTRIYRQWIYQTCAEFGFGQTTKTATSLFKALTFASTDKILYDMCDQAYGISKDETDAAIAATNDKYGGLSIDVENVIFPNGNIDPWSALGLTNATGVVNAASQIVHIDGTSHCGDMFAPKPTDSASLQWAHERIEVFVDQLLESY